MKKIVIAVLIFAGASTVSFAQSMKNKTQTLQASDTKQIGVEMNAKAETDKMAKALTLTPDQKTQIHAVNMDIARNQEMLKQAGPNVSPDRTKFLMKHKDAEYKKVLTADQYAKYEKIANGANVGTPKGSN